MVLAAVILLLSLAGNLALFTQSLDFKKTIAKYQDIESLNQRSEEFVKAYIKGESKEYLTSNAQSRFASALKESGHDNHNPHGDSGLKSIEVSKLFTKPINGTTNQAESYASAKLRYDMKISDTYADDYFQDVTVKSKWLKEGNVWKVDEVSVSVQQDSNDDQLRDQAERALENAADTSGGDAQ